LCAEGLVEDIIVLKPNLNKIIYTPISRGCQGFKVITIDISLLLVYSFSALVKVMMFISHHVNALQALLARMKREGNIEAHDVLSHGWDEVAGMLPQFSAEFARSYSAELILQSTRKNPQFKALCG